MVQARKLPEESEPGRKRCRRCLHRKRPEEFARHARTADGRQSWCRNCNRITRQLYRQQKTT